MKILSLNFMFSHYLGDIPLNLWIIFIAEDIQISGKGMLCCFQAPRMATSTWSPALFTLKCIFSICTHCVWSPESAGVMSLEEVSKSIIPVSWFGHQLNFRVEILGRQEGNMTGFLPYLCVILVFSLRQSELETMTLGFLEKGQWRTQRKGKHERKL